MSSALLVTLLVAIAWIVFWTLVRHVGVPALARVGGGDAISGLLRVIAAVPTRLLWRTEYVGWDAMPDRPGERGLLVVANHTAGIDPILVEYPLRFSIRWMMWEAMMIGPLEGIWRQRRVLPISFTSRDAGVVREAIRHLRGGGAVGIFPEGGIERPAERLRPFNNGVGVLATRTGADVALVWISGVPETPSAWGSLFRRCRARVELIDVLRFDRQTAPADAVAAIEVRFVEASGWPRESEPLVEDGNAAHPA